MRSGTAPLISVMITVYNCERYLGEAIESVQDQTYRPLELILVDDGSDDASSDVAQRYCPFVQYVYTPHVGMGAARNKALELAQGDLFAFLDADDRYLKDKLERQAAVLEADPALEAVFGHVREFISPDLDACRAARLRAPAASIPGHFAAAMLVRREAFFRVGRFAPHLKLGIGLDWYARSREQRLKSVMLPEPMMERRLHTSNTGLRERESRTQYVQVLKASLDRRRKRA